MKNETEIKTPVLQEHVFVPSDEIRPELIPALDQWAIDKSADLVDRVLEQLGKNGRN